jgi:glycolate oxidase iron-sulfur subunit
VQYGRLADIGRKVVEEQVGRSWPDRVRRGILQMVLPYPSRFAPVLALGRAIRPILPRVLRRMVPPRDAPGSWPIPRYRRRMLVLDGCVQPALAPRINAATARVLSRFGISLVRANLAGCCGAMSYHLTAQDQGLKFARRNIDAWWPELEDGAEAIVITASGCGVFIKEYGHLLRHDSRYADKAARVSAATRDIAEILVENDIKDLDNHPRKIAFQCPCSLQHGQKLGGVVENFLRKLSFELTPVPDEHLCCGSAGTYSILQKGLSQRLLTNKLKALESGAPDMIVTANIGCLTHLQTRANVPVKHWIELLDIASD